MTKTETPARGSWALITGASSGIGKCYALYLAAKGIKLVLVARRADALESLGRSLREEHGVQTLIIVKDLTLESSPKEIFQEVESRGITIDLLINNAGFGEFGILHEGSLEKNRRMLMLNVVATSALTQLFVTAMIKRDAGTIVNVASTAAFQPLPYMANYGASKAFILSFTEALWGEYQHTGIRILAVCPGATDTEFFKSPFFTKRSGRGSKRIARSRRETDFQGP